MSLDSIIEGLFEKVSKNSYPSFIFSRFHNLWYKVQDRLRSEHGKVIITGDCDTDGICGIVGLYRSLTKFRPHLANKVSIISRSRDEGYELDYNKIDELSKTGLVILVDNGTDYALQSKNDNVIVFDHHLPKSLEKLDESQIPESIVNPILYGITDCSSSIINTFLYNVDDLYKTSPDFLLLVGSISDFTQPNLLTWQMLRYYLRLDMLSKYDLKLCGYDPSPSGIRYTISSWISAIGRLGKMEEGIPKILAYDIEGMKAYNAIKRSMIAEALTSCKKVVLRNNIDVYILDPKHLPVVSIISSSKISEKRLGMVIATDGKTLSVRSRFIDLTKVKEKIKEVIEINGHQFAMGGRIIGNKKITEVIEVLEQLDINDFIVKESVEEDGSIVYSNIGEVIDYCKKFYSIEPYIVKPKIKIPSMLPVYKITDRFYLNKVKANDIQVNIISNKDVTGKDVVANVDSWYLGKGRWKLTISC